MPITYLKKSPEEALAVEEYLKILLSENKKLTTILENSKDRTDMRNQLAEMAIKVLKSNPKAMNYYLGEETGIETYECLRWRDFAAIRILDYIDNSGLTIEDKNLDNEIVVTNPFKILYLDWLDGSGFGEPDFYEDMIQLFRQLQDKRVMPSYPKEKIIEWMDNNPCGTDDDVIALRKQNRDRILNIILDKIDNKEYNFWEYTFPPNLSRQAKFISIKNWWHDRWFHLKFAVRDPDTLNEFLGGILSEEIMDRLYRAKKAGIPTFVNPYYLSLVNVNEPEHLNGADASIRQYVIYSESLIKEYGSIHAWEMEDEVEPGKPNAAGWLLPTHDNIHRRYPSVAILIPDTVGRACGGLCSSCQRMYDFQSGHLNFELEKLNPTEEWHSKLRRLMNYWETDSQLCDILVTGGDALMSNDSSLEEILNAIYCMAKRKIDANHDRPDGQKYAEILRVRLGSRLPIYLPQRINTDLVKILAYFKEKASKIGIKQFIIQTHFESAMEITPESREAVRKLLSAGWTVTNQQVFTSGGSKRGHTNKLRKMLNDIGVVTYYTFTVKGYQENKFNFSTNARAVQEQLEEKIIGKVPEKWYEEIKDFPLDSRKIIENINKVREEADIPFLSTDRNVLNLPGVGKSQTFRCIGITRKGRRILRFGHDQTRMHSPVIEKMPSVFIAESKTMAQYLKQLQDAGENIENYEDVLGYSIGETEYRLPIFDYPEYDFDITDEITNLEIPEE